MLIDLSSHSIFSKNALLFFVNLQVIEELLNLIKLFCGVKYTSSEDLILASNFKTKTIELVCNSIEWHNAWMTLVKYVALTYSISYKIVCYKLFIF